MGKIIQILCTLVLLLGCARGSWEFNEGNQYQKELGKTFVVMKGKKATQRFFTELEPLLNKRLSHGGAVPYFLHFEGSDFVAGEKEKVLRECERARCTDILLINLEKEVKKTADSTEQGEEFYLLRASLIDPKIAKPSWRAQREMDVSDVEGIGLGLTIQASRVSEELTLKMSEEKILQKN